MNIRAEGTIFTEEDHIFSKKTLVAYDGHGINSLLMLEKGEEVVIAANGISPIALSSGILKILFDRPDILHNVLKTLAKVPMGDSVSVN